VVSLLGLFLVVSSSRVILLYHSLPGWKSWDNGGVGRGKGGVVGLAVVSHRLYRQALYITFYKVETF
jgi:hypothetical protein